MEAGNRTVPRRMVLVIATPLVLLPVVFLVGFAVFLTSLEPVEREPKAVADGIVALTGGAGRIEDAIDLLAKGFAGRLLITGVNERTSRESIGRLAPGQRDLVRCCVDLDYRARNTIGNAAEISRWARQNGLRSLIIVTSDYHLPRALAELDEVLPDVEKVPYAVVAPHARGDLPLELARIRLLLSEYVKFVAVAVRTRVAGWRASSRLSGRPDEGAAGVAKRASAG